MIFSTYISIDSKLWEVLPATTNAQESLYFQLYYIVGYNKRFFEELKSFYSWALFFEDNYKNKQYHDMAKWLSHYLYFFSFLFI